MTARRRLVDQHRRNNVIQFPARGPFAVHVSSMTQTGWLVVCRSHGWLHANKQHAIRDAEFVAGTFGVAVKVTS